MPWSDNRVAIIDTQGLSEIAAEVLRWRTHPARPRAMRFETILNRREWLAKYHPWQEVWFHEGRSWPLDEPDAKWWSILPPSGRGVDPQRWLAEQGDQIQEVLLAYGYVLRGDPAEGGDPPGPWMSPPVKSHRYQRARR